MAVNVSKFLSLVGGTVREVAALVTSSGAADAGKIPALGADGKLDPSMLPTFDVVRATAAEPISKGDFTYINSAGKIARASAATGGHAATGFANASIAKDAVGEHVEEGQNSSLTGLSPGARVYLSADTPGGWTHDPVSGAGKLHQYLGDALSANAVGFEPDDAIVLA